MNDYGIECENCECLTCKKNDDNICFNCSKCNGNMGYNRWKMNCKKYDECDNPEEIIKLILNIK